MKKRICFLITLMICMIACTNCFALTKLHETVNTKVINLVSYLNQFDFRKSDIGIDISYSLFLILALLIVGYIISVIIREFKAAFERKVK